MIDSDLCDFGQARSVVLRIGLVLSMQLGLAEAVSQCVASSQVLEEALTRSVVSVLVPALAMAGATSKGLHLVRQSDAVHSIAGVNSPFRFLAMLHLNSCGMVVAVGFEIEGGTWPPLVFGSTDRGPQQLGDCFASISPVFLFRTGVPFHGPTRALSLAP